jgi:selenide,water dikinase
MSFEELMKQPYYIPPFDPTEHGLPKGFRLTKYTQQKGCGCKVPQATLKELLGGLKQNLEIADMVALSASGEGESQRANPILGIGLDSCVIPLRHHGLRLVQTTDFFFPNVDNPIVMGRITGCNVLSDLYAMGVVDCDNILMLLAVSTTMKEEEMKICTRLVLEGYQQVAAEAGTGIQGGQTVRNPWLLLGGVATSVCREIDYILPSGGQPGDVLVLTKPLGFQVAVNVYQWLQDYKEVEEGLVDPGLPEEEKQRLQRSHQRWQKCSKVITEAEVLRAFDVASRHMSRLNKNAAKLMHKYGAHGATDVTGFGILGHSTNLVECQDRPVNFIINNLPIIPGMVAVDAAVDCLFNLMKGRSAETSGGLLIMLPPNAVSNFCDEIKQLDGFSAWAVGTVEKADEGSARKVIFHENLRVTVGLF